MKFVETAELQLLGTRIRTASSGHERDGAQIRLQRAGLLRVTLNNSNKWMVKPRQWIGMTAWLPFLKQEEPVLALSLKVKLASSPGGSPVGVRPSSFYESDCQAQTSSVLIVEPWAAW